MKYENVIYSICCLLVIVGSVLKILHLPYGNQFIYIGFIAITIFQAVHVSTLKKRIKELEVDPNTK
jgi:hypothetical protein